MMPRFIEVDDLGNAVVDLLLDTCVSGRGLFPDCAACPACDGQYWGSKVKLSLH